MLSMIDYELQQTKADQSWLNAQRNQIKLTIQRINGLNISELSVLIILGKVHNLERSPEDYYGNSLGFWEKVINFDYLLGRYHPEIFE